MTERYLCCERRYDFQTFGRTRTRCDWVSKGLPMRQHHRAFFRSAALPPTRRPPSFFLLRPLRHGIPRSPALYPFRFSTDSMSQSTFRYKSRSSPEFTSSKRPLALPTSLLERFFLLRFVYGESLPTSDIDHRPRGYETSFFHAMHVILFLSFSFYLCWNLCVTIENY